MMQQYVHMKSQYAADGTNRILLFRVGDFYEAFFDDAYKLSSALDIVCTTVSAGKKVGRITYVWYTISFFTSTFIKFNES